MKLILVRTASSLVIGEILTRSSGEGSPTELNDPMLVSIQQIPQPSKLAGQPPQIITAFQLVPFPCDKIEFVAHCEYFGEVDKHDGLAVTYYKVLEAKRKAQEDPLMIVQ